MYAGLGGNRKHWEGQVTAVENDPKIAEVYTSLYPQDTMVIADAHEYLLNNYQNFDFIWSSPPCQSHSKMIRSGRNRKPRYPDLKLYEEILLLQHNFERGDFKGKDIIKIDVLDEDNLKFEGVSDPEKAKTDKVVVH